MHNVGIIYRKELAAFFYSPVAYIVLLVFSLITAWMFTNTFFLMNQSDLRALFEVVPLVLVFFVPAITMGLVAREKQAGTVEFLFTMPLTDVEIVAGKFLAGWTLMAVVLGFTLVHFVTLLFVGTQVDIGALVCGYMGLLLVGAFYTSIGILGSAVTGNQIVAFIVSFLIIFVFFIMEKALVFFPTFLSAILQYASVDYHLNNIARGVVDSRNLIYFGSGITTFLLLSTRILEMRKWK